MEHFKELYSGKLVKEYDRVDPHAARWRLSRGHFDPSHYQHLIDLMENVDVI